MGLSSWFKRSPPELPLIIARRGLLLPGVTAAAPHWDTFVIRGDEAALQAALADKTQVVVAFETERGLHLEGVVADIVAAAPFDEGVDAQDYGATQRYTFVARQRCRLPPTITRAPTPRVRPELLEPRADDALTLPPDIEARYGLLAESGSGWRQRYDRCVGKPLGTWILYGLQGEAPIAWFDRPELVIDAVRTLVERMVPLIHEPTSMKLIAAELAPRATTTLPERVVHVATDGAMWMLFHPQQVHDARLTASMALAFDAPTWRAYVDRGLVVGVTTGGDGVYGVRFTAGALTDDERERLIAGAEMPLRVEHGRLFLWEQVLDRDDAELGVNPESWIDVPNGLYRARVSVVATDDEYDPDGGDDEDIVAYVVQLEPVDHLIAGPPSCPRLDAFEAPIGR